jgi:hypothetical protein
MKANLPSVEDLIADPGITIHPGPVITDGTDGDSESSQASRDPSTLGSKTHYIDSVMYIDGAGHLHAVLIDTVTISKGLAHTTTIEILDDVILE